jgi:uncharacterized protein (DUF58 family)
MCDRSAFHRVLFGSFLVLGAGLLARMPFLCVVGYAGFLYATLARLFAMATERAFFSRRLRVHRTIERNFFFLGDRVDILLKIVNDSPFTFRGIEVVEECDFRLCGEDKRWCGSLPPYSTTEVSYQVTTLTCGEIWVYGTRLLLRSADGLFAFERLLPTANLLRVYPRLESARLKKRPVNRGSMLVGSYQRPVKGIGSEFSDLRSYMPGDPLRSIEWKASVRTGQLVVREFESEALVRSCFILDATPSMYEGSVGRRKIDFSISIIANLVENFIRERDMVSLAAFRHQRGLYRRIPNGQGGAHIYRILDFLVEIAQPATVESSVAPGLFMGQVWEYLKLVDPRICQGEYSARSGGAAVARFLEQCGGGSVSDADMGDAAVQLGQLLACNPGALAPVLQKPGHYAVNKATLLGDLLEQLVNEAKEDGLILIFSDLEGLENQDQARRLIDRCRLAQAHHQTVFILAPFTPGFEGDDTRVEASARMQEVVKAAYFARAADLHRELVEKLQVAGVNVMSLFAPEALQVLLRRFEQIKLRKGMEK